MDITAGNPLVFREFSFLSYACVSTIPPVDEAGSETRIPSCFSGKIEEEADPVETGSGVATTSGEAAPAEELSEDISINQLSHGFSKKETVFRVPRRTRDRTKCPYLLFDR